MKYKDKELTEFKPTENIIFDKPKRMLVWYGNSTNCFEADIIAVLPSREHFPVVGVKGAWEHCAEIPEEPKSKLATNRELAKWLAQGNGERKSLTNGEYAFADYDRYKYADENKAVQDGVLVRKWEDADWHVPTREYLGLEG